MTFEDEHLTRQLDIVPMKILDTPITVIGAGAIGGWTVLALAKMGFANIDVFDHDIVDTVNMNSQFFRFSDIGKPKVMALRELVADFTRVEIGTYNCRYEPHMDKRPGIVIVAVDNMETRRAVWEQYAGRAPFTKAIIDPRMGAEDALLYVMNPMDDRDRETYPKSLYSDTDALQERCTAKATIYCANMLSGLVCKAVKDVLTRPDYLRHAQWSIAENEMFSFKRGA